MSSPYSPWGDFDAPHPSDDPKPSWGIPSPMSSFSGYANPLPPYNPNEGFKYGPQPVNLGPQLPDLGPKPVGPSYTPFNLSPPPSPGYPAPYPKFDPSPPPQPGYVPGAINTPWAPSAPIWQPFNPPYTEEKRPMNPFPEGGIYRDPPGGGKGMPIVTPFEFPPTPGLDNMYHNGMSYNDADRGQPSMPFFKKKRPQISSLQQWLMSRFGLRGM